MPAVHSTWNLDASPQTVWDLLCDIARYAESVIPTERILATPDGVIGVGARYRESGGIGPFTGTSDWVVTEFDVLRHQVHGGDDGMVRIRLRMDLATTEHGARVLQRLELTPRWFIAPLFYLTWPLFMRRKSQAAMDQTGANLQRLLHADA